MGASLHGSILALFGAGLIAAVVFDLRRREIPDAIPFSLALLGLVAGWLDGGAGGLARALWGALVGTAIGTLAWLALGFGGGDVKLVAALGAGLGASALIDALVWGALLGAVPCAVAWLRGAREVAYAPALVLGALLGAGFGGGPLHVLAG